MPIQTKVLALLAIMAGAIASPEPGEIPLNSPPGPVGGDGTDNIHWYQQESLNGELYEADPPKMPEPLICNETDQSVACSGKMLRSNRELYEFPGLVYVMVYVEVDERIHEPWRFALKQIRKVNRTYQRSGIPVQFLVAAMDTADVAHFSITGYLNNLRGRAGTISRRTGADLVIGLLSDRYRYSWCGLANVGSGYGYPQTNVTACYSKHTLAHEIGHSFGLMHDAGGGVPFVEGGRGYKIGESGTIMAYANSRIPFFSSPKLKYKGKIYGNDRTDAVTALKDALGNIAMAHESMLKNDQYSFDERMDVLNNYENIEYCE